MQLLSESRDVKETMRMIYSLRLGHIKLNVNANFALACPAYRFLIHRQNIKMILCRVGDNYKWRRGDVPQSL